MIFIYLHYSLRHHRNMLPCSIGMTVYIEKQKNTCRLPHCFGQQQQPFVVTDWNIQTNQIVILLTKGRAPRRRFRLHQIQCKVCTLGRSMRVQVWRRERKKCTRSSAGCVHSLRPLPQLGRCVFLERRTQKSLHCIGRDTIIGREGEASLNQWHHNRFKG